MKLEIKDLQKAQQNNQRRIAALRPSSALGRGVQFMGLEGLRVAISVTHVDSGALKAAHRLELDLDVPRAQIDIDPGATAPDGDRPAEYGPFEQARGGDHAFYAIVEALWPDLTPRAWEFVRIELAGA